MPKPTYIVPRCCTPPRPDFPPPPKRPHASRPTIAVYLGLTPPPCYDYCSPAAEDQRRPRWVMRCHNYFAGHGMDEVEVFYCPFCGVRLPEIEPNPKPPAKVFRLNAEETHCATCGKRPMCCQCHPEESLWRAKRGKA